MAGARMRQLRGMEIVSKGGQVRRITDVEYLVRSQHTRACYKVQCEGDSWLCECPDYEKRNTSCKHIYAVIFLLRLPSIILSNAVPLSSELAEKQRIRGDFAREGMIP